MIKHIDCIRFLWEAGWITLNLLYNVIKWYIQNGEKKAIGNMLDNLSTKVWNYIAA